ALQPRRISAVLECVAGRNEPGGAEAASAGRLGRLRGRAPGAARCDAGNDRPLAGDGAARSVVRAGDGIGPRVHPHVESRCRSAHPAENVPCRAAGERRLMMSTSTAAAPARQSSRTADFAVQVATLLLRPAHALMAAPTLLFLAALTVMLLRHPDVSFYEVDRVAFGLLVVGVVGRAMVRRQRIFVERATWPMLGLTLLAVASAIGHPFDNETGSLLAAKFIVPFTLFHLAGLVFQEERQFRVFETFALVVLAYLSFTAIAFLVGANSLIFPSFILDESLGFHADRARGPLLQAVANGVSLNLLALLALHAILYRTSISSRTRICGRKCGVRGLPSIRAKPAAAFAA